MYIYQKILNQSEKKLYSMQIFITFKIHLQSSQVKNFLSTPLYIINTFGKLYNYILHGIPVIVIWFQRGRRSSWYSNVQYIQYMYLHRLGISFYKPLINVQTLCPILKYSTAIKGGIFELFQRHGFLKIPACMPLWYMYIIICYRPLHREYKTTFVFIMWLSHMTGEVFFFQI